MVANASQDFDPAHFEKTTGMEEQDVKVPETPAAEEELSALRENIQRKGANSYYYAWGGVDDLSASKYRPQPLGASSSPVRVEYRSISSYSWADEPKRVKIYIKLEDNEFEGLVESNIRFDLDLRSLDLVLDMGLGSGQLNRRLYIPKLFGDIDIAKSKVRRKPERVIITLFKADDFTWKSLIRQ